MAGQEHHYATKLVWTGAEQGPTRDVRSFSREYRIDMEGKAPIRGSSDPAFRGDPALHNPEDLLVAALSACHMLWYLHLCAVKGIEVRAYEDAAEGVMLAEPRNGRFTEVTLRPMVTVAPGSDRERALSLHERAHAECYVANSVNFPVRCEPQIVEAA
ncbi:MAG: OsmC family protein [Alphaproteobacteria bacterium]|nr:OsmC family protein [Alphaproteobacteria bacterium]